MAELIEALPPGHWSLGYDKGCVDVGADGVALPPEQTHQCADPWDEHMARERAAFEAIDPDRVWSSPVGDGYAYYYIHSESPLVLSHIPYLDGYRVLPPTIRGLRLEDIELDRRFQRLLAGG